MFLIAQKKKKKWGIDKRLSQQRLAEIAIRLLVTTVTRKLRSSRFNACTWKKKERRKRIEGKQRRLGKKKKKKKYSYFKGTAKVAPATN